MLLMLCLLVFQSGQEKFSASAAIKHSVEARAVVPVLLVLIVTLCRLSTVALLYIIHLSGACMLLKISLLTY